MWFIHRGWREAMVSKDPDHFSKLAETQSPEYLWIGCADSRVPVRSLRTLCPLAPVCLVQLCLRCCHKTVLVCPQCTMLKFGGTMRHGDVARAPFGAACNPCRRHSCCFYI